MKDPRRSHHVSLRDIARGIGVSHVTVSLALRGHPRISPHRASEIRRVAKEMGYRSSPMLDVLNSYRRDRGVPPRPHPSIAWLNFWLDPDVLRSYREFDGYWRGTAGMAAACGFRLEEICVAEIGLDRLGEELRRRHVQGLLLPPLPDRVDALVSDRWAWEEYPIVGFGHTLAELPVSMVACDQATMARTAFAKARALGYQRIGLVMNKRALATTLFGAGFLGAQQDVLCGDRLPILALSASDRATYAKELAAWIKRHRPDALLTGVAELRGCLETLGLRVPRDLGLAALSVLDGNADAGIDQHPEEIGRVAVETLISLINRGQRGPLVHRQKILVSGRWMNGSSLPPRESPAPE